MILTSFVNYLKNDIPRHTNAFTDQLVIQSLANSGGTITVTTSSEHKLSTGHYISITGAKRLLSVSSLTREGNIVTVTTSEQHDYTQNFSEEQYVTIRGANQSAYNGKFLVKSVLSGTRITYEIPTTDPMPTTPATGSITIDDARKSIDGSYQVTVISPTSFSFHSPNAIDEIISSSLSVHARHRITGYLNNLDTFLENLKSYDDGNPFYSYSLPWLIITPEGTRTSKDRNARVDTSGTSSVSEYIRLSQIHTVTIMILYNTSQQNPFYVGVHDKAVRDSSDLLKSILAYRPTQNFAGEAITGLSLNSHGPYIVTSNRFVYALSFDYTSNLNFRDSSGAYQKSYAINAFDFDLTSGDPTITAAGYIP